MHGGFRVVVQYGGFSVATVSDFSAFANLERSGWLDAKRALGYVELFSSVSDQAIDSLLNAADASPNLKALDLCCGQGNLSEALLRRGCKVFGIDFSPAMLAFAPAKSTRGNLHRSGRTETSV